MKFFLSIVLILVLSFPGGRVLAKSSASPKKQVKKSGAGKALRTDKKRKIDAVQAGDREEVKNPAENPALKDLKLWFAHSLRTAHDDVFTDPAVAGLSLVPLRLNVPAGEGAP